jgi:hypothetical protein
MIYRFKFTDEFMNHLHYFAKIHQYDNRILFKESWNQWTEENAVIIQKETQRLNQLGFSGNILEKMYKSARYYYRKKPQMNKIKIQTCRKSYVGVPYELLVAMDEHLKNMHCHPKFGFRHFCQTNEVIIKQSIAIILSADHIHTQEICGKIKKTYKNRYFIQKRRRENSGNS